VSINGLAVQSWSEAQWELMQRALAKGTAELVVERTSSDASNGKVSRVVDLPLQHLNVKDLEGDFLSKLGFSLARPAAVLGEIVPGGPAELAGLRQDDRVLAVNGVAVLDGLAFTEIVSASPGTPLTLHILRNRSEFDIVATPESESNAGVRVGRLKVKLMLAPEMTVVRAGFADSLLKAGQKTWDTSLMSLKMLGKMLVGEVSLKNVTGPLTIADYAGQTSRTGLISYLSFMALISISLGVMNLLPIPVLDGGHLLYYSLEVLTGKPVSERFGEIAQRAGLALLMAIMAVAFLMT